MVVVDTNAGAAAEVAAEVGADIAERWDAAIERSGVGAVVVSGFVRSEVSGRGRYREDLKGAGPEFELFVRLMRENPRFWSKVSCPERLSMQGPHHYGDVVPFARRIVESFPDRVLWGTDWPHPNMKSHMPDDGHLVDIIPQIAVTAELQRELLVDNPMRLYWPEEV